jgi:hypothetical protein
MRARLLGLLGSCLALLLLASPAMAGSVKAGAAIVDGTYHVGSSAGQYASTRDGGYGDPDPHVHSVKNMASYGVQSREKVRALVVQGSDGKIIALVSDNHYIPQDALFKRTAQLLDAATGGAINATNLTMSVTHNHSSPSYSSFDPGVWTFQDAFDFRFFDYYARQNAAAILKAYRDLHKVRVSGTVSNFDAFQRNPMGAGTGDDGTPVGFPRPYTDHDLSVVHFQNIDSRKHPKPLATLVNIGQHPEFLDGYDLISGEYPEAMSRLAEREGSGVTVFTQNATGTSEVERDNWHNVHDRELFDHAQYAQMEWGARQLASEVVDDVHDIEAQKPNEDDVSHFGMTPYADRFVAWMTDFPVAMENRWFPGPASHPYPGVSSCRTDAALQGNPRVPVAGLPDCEEVPAGSSLSPVLGGLPVGNPGISTDTFEALGIPIPENYSAPSHGALEDTLGVHLQAFRLGDILFTVCSCEQWVDQSYNIKTRTDTVTGNEYLGYDPTAEDAHPQMRCEKTDAWRCTTSGNQVIPDEKIAHMQAQIRNDAAGWDDPVCMELGCGAQAESEPTDLSKIRGNYTHDDTTVGGGKLQTPEYAANHGYKMTVTIAMANDYNGYIATYRDYMNHDHYRKALTGWGPHSSDYMATRLARLGHALKGDAEALKAIDEETVPEKASAGNAPSVAKEVADQAAAEAKVRVIGEASTQAAKAYDATLPDDGGSEDALVQPKDIERFDAATFTWDGGNNYTDDPVVTVQRKRGNRWVKFADQSGEIPVTVKYPGEGPQDIATYRAGGQVWKWTATFEAFVSRFALADPQGRAYRATPAGEYRFVVKGAWRRGGGSERYTRASKTFTVAPWSGITVENVRKGASGTVAFTAGPTHVFEEFRARSTEKPPLKRNADGSEAGVKFTIGPVDYPDFMKTPVATGARFLNGLRGYSAAGPDDVEHYCLDCRFRDWMDSTGELTAEISFVDAEGHVVTETAKGVNGKFFSKRAAKKGETVEVVITDAWGNTSGKPVAL